MKRFTRLCLILAGIFAVCGIACGASGCAMGAVGDLKAANHSTEHAESLTVPTGDLDALTFSLSSDDAAFGVSPDDDIHIQYTPSAGRTYDGSFETVDGQAVYVFRAESAGHSDWKSLFSMNYVFGGGISSVTVLLPGGMALPVTVESSSGEVQMDGVTAGNLALTTASGEITLREVSGDGLTVSASSGDMDASGCTFSGSVSVTSTSGEIDLSNTAISSDQPTVLTSTSGEISVEGAAISGDLTAKSASGDVDLSLSGSPLHRMGRIQSASGEISVAGGSDAGAHTISVQTTSGDIRVRDGG